MSAPQGGAYKGLCSMPFGEAALLGSLTFPQQLTEDVTRCVVLVDPRLGFRREGRGVENKPVSQSFWEEGDSHHIEHSVFHTRPVSAVAKQ